MIEGMIGAAFVLSSFVGGYFFRKKQEVVVDPKEYVEQDRQLPPDVEAQINNIMNLWK